jgi:type I restriction enzyme, R subunit
MRLLIVVDKLLTGFDAPSATYLYIDKQMRDHGLFQAICRVNRLDGEDKEYGYIVDYKDLFRSLEGAISDYTGGAFDGYDQADVAELLTNRLQKGRERLEETREAVKALCEPVDLPRDTADYLHYFCAADTTDKEALRVNEPKRVALYKAVAALMRAYASLANELAEAGYAAGEIAAIRQETIHYDKVDQEVKIASGDLADMKQFEPAMRHLLDTYIRADDSQKISDFDNLGLVELLINKGAAGLDDLPEGIRQSETAMAETIENNIRRIITDERPVNPRYYDEMSELLIALTNERRQQALDYKLYTWSGCCSLARQVVRSRRRRGDGRYPASLTSRAKRNLYDTLDGNEELALLVDTAVLTSKKDGWIGNRFKEREVSAAIREQDPSTVPAVESRKAR